MLYTCRRADPLSSLFRERVASSTVLRLGARLRRDGHRSPGRGHSGSARYRVRLVLTALQPRSARPPSRTRTSRRHKSLTPRPRSPLRFIIPAAARPCGSAPQWGSRRGAPPAHPLRPRAPRESGPAPSWSSAAPAAARPARRRPADPRTSPAARAPGSEKEQPARPQTSLATRARSKVKGPPAPPPALSPILPRPDAAVSAKGLPPHPRCRCRPIRTHEPWQRRQMR